MTAIEWTEETWNPIVGCSVVSPGCTNCYAMRQAARLLDGNPRTPHYAGTTQTINGQPVWTGQLAQASDRKLTQPLGWDTPRRVFVNSMGDLFHEDVPDAWIDRVFAIMAMASRHTFQVLTKRPERMQAYVTGGRWENINAAATMVILDLTQNPTYSPQTRANIYYEGRESLECATWPLSNVWLGVSVEDQRRADERIPLLLDTPAAVRFISAEPLLEPVSLDGVPWPESFSRPIDDISDGIHPLRYHGPSIDWVIVGGESGPGARDMDPAWARTLRDQCADAGVAFFMKQMAHKADIPADLRVRQYPSQPAEARA